MEDNYVPYGPEWEKEMMKLPKKFIIDMLRKALQENKTETNESDSQHSESLN